MHEWSNENRKINNILGVFRRKSIECIFRLYISRLLFLGFERQEKSTKYKEYLYNSFPKFVNSRKYFLDKNTTFTFL